MIPQAVKSPSGGRKGEKAFGASNGSLRRPHERRYHVMSKGSDGVSTSAQTCDHDPGPSRH